MNHPPLQLILTPPMYDLPRLLASVCDDEWTFEDEVCADELGACALHMEWQESLGVAWSDGTEG